MQEPLTENSFKEIGKLTRLISLDIKRTKISIPTWFTYLTNLIYLKTLYYPSSVNTIKETMVDLFPYTTIIDRYAYY